MAMAVTRPLVSSFLLGIWICFTVVHRRFQPLRQQRIEQDQGRRGDDGRRDRPHEESLEALARGAANQPGLHEALLGDRRSEEHTSELQSLMRISYAVFCLTTKHKTTTQPTHITQ